jgi:hypothetical protein
MLHSSSHSFLTTWHQDLCISGWGKLLLHGVKPLLPNPQKKNTIQLPKRILNVKMTRKDLQPTDLEKKITTRNYSGDQKKMKMSGHSSKGKRAGRKGHNGLESFME